jgi:GNAT superfamily N-acetyltransferase
MNVLMLKYSSFGTWLPTLEAMAQDAEAEGFRHVRRLVDDYRSGKNRFDQPGELLSGVVIDGSLIAVGGLNRYGESARVRRVYVTPPARRQGVARFLMQHLEAHAREHGFAELQLRTDTEGAAKFYVSIGFSEIFTNPLVTHRKQLMPEESEPAII